MRGRLRNPGGRPAPRYWRTVTSQPFDAAATASPPLAAPSDPGEFPGLTRPAAPPLVSTKLRPPALHASVCERPRLSARLDAALADGTRLTLVSAPPGYGKSVAVAAWLRARSIPHAWLSLDAADADPLRFARYLLAALATVRPSAAGPAAAGLTGAAGATDVEYLGAALLAVVEESDDPFVLVLDDYHAIASDAVHRLVRFVVEHGPPFAHLVILTRQDPSLPIARLRAHAALVEIRAADLRYELDEAANYLARSGGIVLADDDLGRLIGRTEGWIAGLQLAALSLRDRPDAAAAVEAFHGSHRFVLDYLADEVLGRLEPAFRDFLAAVSIADRFTAELCEALTGRPDAGALLDRAVGENLFIVPLDDEGRWYRFHHLFAEYLRSLLPDDERRELHRRAASFFEAQGSLDEAIGHALAAGVEDAVPLVVAAARPTFDAGELGTLLGWLDALGAERVAAVSELVSLQAWSLFQAGRLPESIAAAERGLAALPDDARGGSAEGRLLAAQAVVSVLMEGDAAAAAPAATRAIELLAGDDLFLSLALLTLGELRLSDGAVVEAVGVMREAFDVARRTRQPMAVFPVLYLLCQGLNAIGGRDEAEALCRATLEEFGDTGRRSLPVTRLARIALGIALYEANDLVEARRELEAGFEGANALGFGRFLLGQGAAVLATVRRLTGAEEAATEALRAGSRDARALRMAPMLPQAEAAEAAAALARGDLAAAGRWADRVVADGVSARLLPRVRLQHDAVAARVRLAQGRAGEALELLRPIDREARAAGVLAFLISILALEALALEALGRHDEAVAGLADAVEYAASGGYVRRLVEVGPSIARLLPAVRDVAPAFVDGLLAALERPAAQKVGTAARTPGGRGGDRPAARAAVVAQSSAVPPARLVEPLTARELDVLRLMAQGKSNAAIASELVVSLATAKWHVGNVLGKLGARSRTQALLIAQGLGLV